MADREREQQQRQESDTRLQKMVDEQRSLQIETATRITQVETRVSVLEISQTRTDKALEKLADAMALQASKSTLNEAAIIAIKERTDDHNRHIEELQKESVDSGKVLEAIKSQVGVMKGVGAAIGIAAIGVIVTHVFHILGF